MSINLWLLREKSGIHRYSKPYGCSSMVYNDGENSNRTDYAEQFYCKIGYRRHYLVYPASCAPSA